MAPCARWLVASILVVLHLAAATPDAHAQLAVVALAETNITAAHDATTVTLTLTTTKAFTQAKSFEISLAAGSVSAAQTVTLSPGEFEESFTVRLAEFEAARRPDRSMTIRAVVEEPTEVDGSTEVSEAETTITVDARPAAPAPQFGQLTLTKTIEVGLDAVRGEFSFSLSGALNAGIEFSPARTSTNSRRPVTEGPFSIPANGTVTITDEAPTGYKFTSATCTIGGAPHPISSVIGSSFDVTVPAGELVECTVSNVVPTVTPAPSVRPRVDLQETKVDVAHDTESVTLKLTTTKAFNAATTIPLAITAGGQANFQTAAAVLPKDATDVEFAIKKSEFVSALEPDGSLQLIVKIDDAELDGSFDIGNSETVIDFAAPSATPAPVPPAAPTAPPPVVIAPTLTLQTLSTDSTGTFQFTVQSGGSSRQASIATTRANEVKGLAAFTVTSGRLVITQSETPGFTFFDANCSLGANSHARVIDTDARTVSVQMPATGNVTCTIVNRGTAAHTKTVESRFVKRRAQQLVSHIGQTRRSAGRFSGGRSRSSGFGVSGAGTDGRGQINAHGSLSRLGGALDPDSATAKAAKLGVNASDYGIDDNPGFRSGWDIWTEASWSYLKVDRSKFGGLSSSGQFGVIRAGVDYLISPKFLFGVVAQYDYLSDSAKSTNQDGYRIHGHGWLAGPYVEFALTDNLFFDAKALWGRSKNEVSPDLSYTDQFSTKRWLASARLTGYWSWAHTPRGTFNFLPRAELIWFNENVESYVDSHGIAVDGQDVHLGRFNIGPEFSYRYTTASGLIIEPSIGAQALLNFAYSRSSAGDGLESAARSTTDDTPLESFQMRFTSGLKVELPTGTRIELEGSYTGLGKHGYESVSGKIGLTVPLQ
ncbi:MAG: autotransporter outer membrane beta-barrel domain-containing protein [Hyphomicrobiaceae bacterium]